MSTRNKIKEGEGKANEKLKAVLAQLIAKDAKFAPEGTLEKIKARLEHGDRKRPGATRKRS